MRVVLGLAVIAAIGAPMAHAQGSQQSAQGSLRLLAPPTSAPPASAPPSEAPPPQPTPVAAPPPADVRPVQPPPAAAAPTPAASGWTGPINFSPVAAADLILKVCRASASGEGADLTARAAQLGLGAPGSVQEELSYALPPSAVTWRVPTVDGVVYLFGYGEEPLNCGAAILRPLAEDGFNKVTTLLKDPQLGFASDSTQILQGDVRWERLKSAKGEFIDVMEYPGNSEQPRILRADFLPG